MSRLADELYRLRDWSKWIGACSLITVLAGSVQAAEICANGLDIPHAPCLDDRDPVASCQNRLSDKARDFNARLSLCEALVNLRQHDTAIRVLETGTSLHRDRYTQGLIKLAISNVVEHRSQPTPDAGISTLVSYHTMRCTRLKRLTDCEDAIALDPNTVDAWRGLAEIRRLDDAVVEAIQAYRKVVGFDPDDGSMQTLADLEQQRLVMSNTCLAGTGQAALSACAAARLPGERDERELLLRAGDLAWAMVRVEESEKAYRQASYVREDDTTDRRLVGIANAKICFERPGETSACVGALRGVPENDLTQRITHQLSKRGCALSVASTEESARDLCRTALTSSSTARGKIEIETLIARIPPEIDPSESLREQCEQQRLGAEISDAIDICRRAIAATADNEARLRLTSIVKALEVRVLEQACVDLAQAGAQDAVSTCERALAVVSDEQRERIAGIITDLASSEALEACDAAATSELPAVARRRCADLANAADVAAKAREEIEAIVSQLDQRIVTDACFKDDNDDLDAVVDACQTALGSSTEDTRPRIRSRLDDIEAKQGNILAAAERLKVRTRCLSPWEDPAEGLETCQGAANAFADDPLIATAIGRLEKQLRPYSNAPLSEVAGVGAVTY